MPSGAEIMTRAAILLQDQAHVRWPLEELRGWINEGVMAIVLAKPSASSTTRILELGRGTHQTLEGAAGAPTPLMLLAVKRNLLATDPVRLGGRTVTPVSATVLDAQNPHWHDPGRTPFRREVRHVIYDEQVPREFWVYPGNDGTGRIEAVTSELPLPLVATGDPAQIGSYAGDIGLPEPWSVPLVDYVCSRAQSKDDIGAAPGRAAAHYAQFAAAVGLKIEVEGASSPNARRAAS